MKFKVLFIHAYVLHISSMPSLFESGFSKLNTIIQAELLLEPGILPTRSTNGTHALLSLRKGLRIQTTETYLEIPINPLVQLCEKENKGEKSNHCICQVVHDNSIRKLEYREI